MKYDLKGGSICLECNPKGILGEPVNIDRKHTDQATPASNFSSMLRKIQINVQRMQLEKSQDQSKTSRRIRNSDMKPQNFTERIHLKAKTARISE